MFGWSFTQTLTELLESKIPIKDFWKLIDENEKTHLITRGEKDKGEYSFINIPIEGGYFLNKTVGFEYSKKEELYLKYISNQRLRWRKWSWKLQKKILKQTNKANLIYFFIISYIKPLISWLNHSWVFILRFMFISSKLSTDCLSLVIYYH